MTEATTAQDEGDLAVTGPQRVDLAFEPSGTRVRVPPGVTLFDAASWHGIAIDSTCGGHGTCKKCKVQVTAGSAPVTPLDARAFSPGELRDGWRLACRVVTAGDLRVTVPPLMTRPKAATVHARNARSRSWTGTRPLHHSTPGRSRPTSCGPGGG